MIGLQTAHRRTRAGQIIAEYLLAFAGAPDTLDEHVARVSGTIRARLHPYDVDFVHRDMAVRHPGVCFQRGNASFNRAHTSMSRAAGQKNLNDSKSTRITTPRD